VPPKFFFTDVRIEGATRYPGDQVKIRYKVVNLGDAPGDCRIWVTNEIGKVVYETILRNIQPGSTIEDVSDTITLPEKPGLYYWTIVAYNETTKEVDDRREFTVRVEEPPPPAPPAPPPEPVFRFITVRAEYAGKEPGSPFRIMYSLVNSGNAFGSCEVRVYDHNGEKVWYRRHENIPPYAMTAPFYTGELKLPMEPGRYDWSIEVYNLSTGKVDDKRTITLTVEAPAIAPPAAPANILLYLALGSLAVGAAVAAIAVAELQKRVAREEIARVREWLQGS